MLISSACHFYLLFHIPSFIYFIPRLSAFSPPIAANIRPSIAGSTLRLFSSSIQKTTNSSSHSTQFAFQMEKQQDQSAILTKDIQACGKRLVNGDLVAFPTETVYGLGCNALDESAIRKVFHAKERPFTDPLIAHVLSIDDALLLWDTPSETTAILTALGQAFWPGPLTLVASAAAQVPPLLMANTGYCAVRSPRHATARSLLQYANKLPIAAPSANKFGHVSPTTASHVFDDLQHENVWILESSTAEDSSSARVGVESTVVKIEGTTLTVLRQGAVGATALREALASSDHKHTVTVQVQSTTTNQATVAPGQTIQHYSPSVPSFMVADDCCWDDNVSELRTCVVVDVGGRLAAIEHLCLAYRNLGPNAKVAAQDLFATLRWAEQVPDASIIVVPATVAFDNANEDEGLVGALQDRLTRAASGVVIRDLRTAVQLVQEKTEKSD